MNPRIISLAALIPLTGAACAGPSDASGRSSVRDSAGIEIIENVQPGWAEADAWRVSDAPVLTMGAGDDNPDQMFYRVGGVVRQSDGTIVVANGGSHELRFYAPDGSLRRTVGRQGGGPGEFETLASIEKLPGDSLLALDMRHRRMSLFTATGRHVRDIPLKGASPFVFFTLAGPLGDGTYLTTAPNVRMGPDLLARPIGPARDSLQVFRVDTAGTTVDTLGMFPALWVNVKSIEMGGRSMPMGVPVAFSPGTHVAAGNGIAYIGLSDTYEIRAYAPTGELRRLIRKTHTPHVVTEQDKEQYRETIRNRPGPGGGNAQMRQMMEQMNAIMADPDFAETLPAFGRMHVDESGNLWVSDVRVAPDAPQRWTVFDQNGRLLGTVVMPARLAVTEIGGDYVVGHQTDELDVQHVLMYRLIKP